MEQTIKRRTFLGLSGAAGVGLLTSGCSETTGEDKDPTPGNRPNLLFIFADQFRPQSAGFGGENQTRTPNLDRFAKEGVNFTNAISNTPICSPYRACMLTGRYPHANGVITNFIRLPEEEITIAEVLKSAGYSTGFIGKWHLGGENQSQYEPPGIGRHGFDYWSAFEFNHNHNFNAYFEDDPKPIIDEGYQTDGETERTIRFIERQTPEKPFCLFVAWGPPHRPFEAWNVPPQYLERYSTVEEIPRSQLSEREKDMWMPRQKPVRFTPHQFVKRKNFKGDAITNREIAIYYAMTDWVDDCFGRIVAALDKTGFAKNTITVFSSDHGEMLGSHGLQEKMIYYDESVRIPFLVRLPDRIKPGTTSDACISSVDFMPTLLGLMGVEIPKEVQGMDLSHCALGIPGPEPAGAIIAGYTGYSGFGPGWEYRGVRTKRHTYARSLTQLWKELGNPPPGYNYSKGPEYFLSDNVEDPYQPTNLADNPKYRETREALEEQIRNHLEKTNDRFLPAAEYKKFYDGGRRIRKFT